MRHREKWIVRAHKPTGVLYGFFVLGDYDFELSIARQIQFIEEFGGGAMHILIEGKIASGRASRKRGIWQRDPDDPKVIHFTCPWCGAIGTSEASWIGRSYVESIFCLKKNGGCDRHLSLFYWKKGDEDKDPMEFRIPNPNDEGDGE